MTISKTSLILLASALAAATPAYAAPYASGETNNAGTIQYYLNSTPSNGMVVVTTLPSGTHPTLTPASPAQGLNSFPLGSDTSYTISVSQIGSGTASLEAIAAANTPFSTWGGSPDPRGLGVNAVPKNGPTFGTIYQANSLTGGTAPLSKGKGLFPLHSDFSLAFGATTNALDGSTFSGSGTSGPYKIGVSRVDGSVFVGDLSTAAAGVWMFTPTLTTPTLVLGPLGTSSSVHGLIYGHPATTGSIAGGNLVLYTFDDSFPAPASGTTFGGLGGAIGVGSGYYTGSLEYNPTSNPGGPITGPGVVNNLYRYTIGGAGSLPYQTQPDLALNIGLNASVTAPGDCEVGPDGKLYTTGERSAAGDAPWINVYDPSGTTNLFCSITVSGTDLVRNQIIAANSSYSANAAGELVSVSPDGKFLALGGYYDYIVVYGLTNGIPDLTTFRFISPGAVTSAARGLAWDAADNVYYMSSGTGVTSCYDLGLTTTAVTGNDSTGTNGTFSLTLPNVSANVTTGGSTAIAYQANNSYAGNGATATSATFNIALNGPQAGPITVNFTLTGTATNVVNYTSSTGTSNSVTFPAGVTNETVTITPTANPASGPTLSVILTVLGGSTYSATAPTTATVYLASSGPQVLTIGTTAYPTMYRGTAGDYTGFNVVRYGDSNVAFTIPASAFTSTGTAVIGTDYTNGPVGNYIAAGTNSVIITNAANPISTAYPFTYVGNKSIITTVAGGTSPESIAFSVTGTTTVTTTLLDNANPPETILFSDSLADPTDTGWNLAFASAATPTTLVPNYLSVAGTGSTTNTDYDVEFGYALANDPLIATLPPNGSNAALKVTVNKAPVTYTNGTGTNVVTVTQGASGGVSLYPALAGGVPRVFTGNFALRFSYLNYEDSGGSATEYVDWGINHYGTNALWWAGSFAGGFSNPDIDGVWYSLGCDQGGASFGDVCEFTEATFPNTGYTLATPTVSWNNYAAAFKHPPYNSSGTGAPSTGFGNFGYQWNDAEVKQYNNIVTCSINKTPILTYTNTSGLFKAGDVMLGYNDPFDSVGSAGEVYYSNVRVVSLSGPAITGVSTSSTNVVVTFTSPDTDAAPASFILLSSTAVNGTYTTNTATITQSGATFSAATTVTNGTPAKYFIIQQSNLIK